MAKSISNLTFLIFQALNCIQHTISDEYPCQKSDKTERNKKLVLYHVTWGTKEVTVERERAISKKTILEEAMLVIPMKLELTADFCSNS